MGNNDVAKIWAWPPLVFCVLLLLGLIGDVFYPTQWTGFNLRMRCIISGIFYVSAAYVGLKAHKQMKNKKTPVNPNLPTKAIVTEGIYSKTRNPLYLALILIHAGTVFFNDGLTVVVTWIMLCIFLEFGVVRKEEIYLENKFGKEYLDYKKNVKRWF